MKKGVWVDDGEDRAAKASPEVKLEKAMLFLFLYFYWVWGGGGFFGFVW